MLNKIVFLQTELEECTEVLSQMISRPYLRTPRSKIVQAAQNVQLKRHEFLGAIAKGLVPSDTSPSLKKKHKIFSVEVDVSV
jgi:ankyrin repeat/IBR domain-containing protein 1